MHLFILILYPIPIPADISIVHCWHAHINTHFTPTGISQVKLNCLCLDGGRKLENPERTHTATQTLNCWSFGLFLATAQLEVQTRTVIPPKTTEFYYKSSIWGEAKLDKVTTKTKYHLLFEVKITRRMFTDRLSRSIPVLHTEKSWFDLCVCVCALMRTPVCLSVWVCVVISWELLTDQSDMKSDGTLTTAAVFLLMMKGATSI